MASYRIYKPAVEDVDQTYAYDAPAEHRFRLQLKTQQGFTDDMMASTPMLARTDRAPAAAPDSSVQCGVVDRLRLPYPVPRAQVAAV